MKRLIALFLFIPALASAQVFPAAVYPAAGVTYMEDEFTDLGPLGTGWTYGFYRGLWDSSGICADTTNNGTNVTAYYSGGTIGDNHYSWVVKNYQTASDAGLGAMVRVSGTGASFQGYCIQYQSATYAALYKVTGGDTWTYMEQNFTQTFNAGDTLKIEATGSSTTNIKCYVNSTLKLNWDDSSSPLTTGRPGIDLYRQTTGFASIRYWRGGSL